MKAKLFGITWVALVRLASCQQIDEKEYKIHARALNEAGNPIVGLHVITGKLELTADSPLPLANPVTTEPRKTNDDGIALIKFNSAPEPSGNVTFFGDGYYSTRSRVIWEKDRVGEIQEIIKPIKNPIPMRATFYANSRVMIPDLAADYGYDLELSSFTAPHGHGKHEDIVFRVEGTNDGQGKGKIKLTIRSCGEKSGFVTFSTPNREWGSELISDYLAPEDGYSESMVFRFNSEDMVAAMNQPQDGNLYFRVRTKLNPDGSIKSCHYGKIYGPFTFWAIPTGRGGVATFGMNTSYFNPTPNDRNVEFDPKRNLNPDGNVQKP